MCELAARRARTRSCEAAPSGASGSRARPHGKQAELLHDPLRGDGIGLGERGIDERVQVVVQGAGPLVVAGDERVVQLGHRPRGEVPDAAEMADAAEAQHRVAEQLDARQRDEVGPGLVQDVGDVLEVARRLLDADDVVVRAAQAADRLRRDVDRGPDGHVVDDDRQVGELGRHARVPAEQALLLGTPVVRA